MAFNTQLQIATLLYLEHCLRLKWFMNNRVPDSTQTQRPFMAALETEDSFLHLYISLQTLMLLYCNKGFYCECYNIRYQVSCFSQNSSCQNHFMRKIHVVIKKRGQKFILALIFIEKSQRSRASSFLGTQNQERNQIKGSSIYHFSYIYIYINLLLYIIYYILF